MKSLKIIRNALLIGACAMFLGGLLAFLAAPTFLGVVFITASVVMTVLVYTLLGMLVGGIYAYFTGKEEKNESSSTA